LQGYKFRFIYDFKNTKLEWPVLALFQTNIQTQWYPKMEEKGIDLRV